MSSRDQVAARVAKNKLAHPEKYCPAIRCLYRTGDGKHCPKHGGPERTPDYCPPGWIHTGDLVAPGR